MRTLKRMRDLGYTCAVVEKWNAHRKIRQDLFGFGDVLCIRRGETALVQTTSLDNLASRIAKIAEHENVGAVREAGWRILVHGWRKVNGRWECREVDVS